MMEISRRFWRKVCKADLKNVDSCEELVKVESCQEGKEQNTVAHFNGEDGPPLPNLSKLESNQPKVEISHSTKRWMYRNTIGLAVAFTIVYSAFQGLQNLQSILHSEGGLGLVTLSISYAVVTLSCLITPGLIKILSTKYALLGGFFCHLLYTLANYYPSWYTLVPASLLFGIGSAPLWAAANAHLVQVAVISAPKLGLDQNLLISNLVGIFFFFYRWSQVPGNLASSLIFYPYSAGNETTIEYQNSSASDDDAVCEEEDHRVLNKLYLYILVSVYFVIISIGIIIHCALVSHLPIEREKNMTLKFWFKFYVKSPIIGIFNIMKDYKMILLAPLPLATGLEQSFAYGTFTQVVIAKCFGTYLVGFTIIVFGVLGSLSSIIYGKLLVKWIPRYMLFLFGGGINIGLLIFLTIWNLSPSYAAVFVFISLWAVADAVWNTMTASLVGILYPNQSGLAFSVHRIWQSIGLAIGFANAQFLSFKNRCYITIAVIALALVFNLVLEFKTQSREVLLPWFFSSKKNTPITEEDKKKEEEEDDDDNSTL